MGTTNTGITGSGAYGNTGTGVGRAAVGPGGSVGVNGRSSPTPPTPLLRLFIFLGWLLIV